MSTLWLISFLVWIPGFLLSLMEWFAPRGFACHCRTGWMAYRHLKSPWLFIIGGSYVISGALGVAAGRNVLAVAIVGVYYLWRWWVHSKNSRKKLKDRVLGIVRESAAGLKVVPVYGGTS